MYKTFQEIFKKFGHDKGQINGAEADRNYVDSGGVLCVQDGDPKTCLCAEEKEKMNGETVDV